jgi:hypothetical protein
MKKHIALGLVASTLFLAGCCTTHHVTQWEYKVTVAPQLAGTDSLTGKSFTDRSALEELQRANSQKMRDNVQGFLDGLGKDGWVLIYERDGTFYFKRPIK